MSAILSTEDLNDFIAPGVACIKPVETLPATTTAAPPSGHETEVILDGDHRSAAGPPPAQISLTDCLACSGCVTSAEAVLVSLQSHAEVLSTLDAAPSLRVVDNGSSGGDDDGSQAQQQQQRRRYSVRGLENPDAKLFVASVSPQTRANLAAACGPGVTEAEAGAMLDALFLAGDDDDDNDDDGGGGARGRGCGLAAGGAHGNGFAWVVDTNTAREMTHVLSADEVLGCDSSVERGGGVLSDTTATPPPPPKTPILASSCPGWVCYAEKTHPHVLPHLSRVKSPQALMGTLLKTTLSRALGIPPSRIWHLAVMPCFDKKLEASRAELTDEVWARSLDGGGGGGVRDVDCVITSKEVIMLAESRGLDFFKLMSPPVNGETGSRQGMRRRRRRRRQAAMPFPDPTLQRFLFPDDDENDHDGHLVPPRKVARNNTSRRPSFPSSRNNSNNNSNNNNSNNNNSNNNNSMTNTSLQIYPPNPVAEIGTSGGLLYHILQTRAAQTPGSRIRITPGRNADVVEYAVISPPPSADDGAEEEEEAEGGEAVVFRAARYYGFRNIQNLVRRLKPVRPSRMPGGKPLGSARRPLPPPSQGGSASSSSSSSAPQLGYIEVMACPGGCTNGGGQLTASDPVVVARRNDPPAEGEGKLGPQQQQRQWLAEVDEAYFSSDENLPVDRTSAGDDHDDDDEALGVSRAHVRDVMAYWSDMTGIDLRLLAYTTYREVVSDVGKGGAGEQVVQLAGKIGGGW